VCKSKIGVTIRWLLRLTTSFKSKLKSFLFHAAYTENTELTMECAIGLIVGGALLVPVVTVTDLAGMFICFDRIHERDGRTDTQTPHDGIGRACWSHRCTDCRQKWHMNVFCDTLLVCQIYLNRLKFGGTAAEKKLF